MSLKGELDAFRSEFMAQVSPEIRDAMVRADLELAASGIAQRALKADSQANSCARLSAVPSGTIKSMRAES
jgi:hypothetical protein